MPVAVLGVVCRCVKISVLYCRWEGRMRNSLTQLDPPVQEQITKHYEHEKLLAQRLRSADAAARRSLYNEVYEDLYAFFRQNKQAYQSYTDPRAHARLQMSYMEHLLHPDMSYLEIGPGEGYLACMVAQRVKTAYLVDVADIIAQHPDCPANTVFVRTDGVSIDVPPASIDLAYSNQMMEHLHPDDGLEQMRQVYRALKPGGVYICVTPHRYNGPHDISRYFDAYPTGLHLKEYTSTEVMHLMRLVGFQQVRAYAGGKGRYVLIPMLPVIIVEQMIGLLDRSTQRKVADSALSRLLLGVRLIAYK